MTKALTDHKSKFDLMQSTAEKRVECGLDLVHRNVEVFCLLKCVTTLDLGLGKVRKSYVHVRTYIGYEYIRITKVKVITQKLALPKSIPVFHIDG